MQLLDNSDKRLLPILPRIILEKTYKRVDKIKFIGGGSFGRVYRVTFTDSDPIALKAYRVQGSQQEEARQLEILSGNTSVRMPEVVFTYEDNETALLAMSFIEGKNVLNPGFLLKSKAQKQLFADEVIDGMLEWHSVKGEKFGTLANPVYDSWYDYYKKEKQEPWLRELKILCGEDKFSRKKLTLLCEATKIFNKLPEEAYEPVLIHSDLNIMNIMADPKTLKLTGFIDPCGCMWADREYDLFQFRNMWGDAYGLFRTYKQRCKMSEYTDFRVAYYAAMHEASMRLHVGHILPIWEDLDFMSLKREMKKLK